MVVAVIVAVHVEEQGDGAVLRCLQEGDAVQIMTVYLRPARTLQVAELLLKGSASDKLRTPTCKQSARPICSARSS